MGRMRGFLARLRATLAGPAARRRVDEEFDFHLDMEAEKHVRAGLAPTEARRRALAAFGDAEAHRATMHARTRGASRGATARGQLAVDLRYAWRTLRRSPGLAVAAAITLGVGIGLNGVVFGV